MNTTLHLIFLSILFFLSFKTTAQKTTDSLVIVKMRGGKELLGTIKTEDDEKIVLQTLNADTIMIYWADMKRVDEAGKGRIIKGKFWHENLYTANYFLGPSAIGLNKGEGFYHNGLVFGNQVQYGITNRFSLRIFAAPFFLLDEDSPIIINPQLRIPIQEDKVNLGLGFMYIIPLPGRYTTNTLIPYGVVTLGSKERNVSFSLGYFPNGDSDFKYFISKIDAIFRISRRIYIISENYIFIDSEYLEDISGIFSLGGRYAGKRIAFDFGAGAIFDYLLDDPDITPFPWLGITVPFGR